jgi:hypothetical protein
VGVRVFWDARSGPQTFQGPRILESHRFQVRRFASLPTISRTSDRSAAWLALSVPLEAKSRLYVTPASASFAQVRRPFQAFQSGFATVLLFGRSPPSSLRQRNAERSGFG